MDLLVHYWSETHHEVKVKYLTFVMFGYSKGEDVVKDMLDVLDKLAILIKLMASLGMDAEELYFNLYYFFKRSSCKRKDVFEIEESLGWDGWLHFIRCRIIGCHFYLLYNV